MTTRMIWKDATPRTSAAVNGHLYAGDPNVMIDAPDADVAGMVSAGWVQGPAIGPTAQRPAATAGTTYIDSSLGAAGLPGTGRVIIADGTIWRDLLTGVPV
jgi:hypothetical protein